MGKIIAIGGGSLQSKKDPRSTFSINAEILNLTNKKKPKVLFIPTASDDDQEYCEMFINHFQNLLKAKVEVLRLYDKSITKKEIKEKILKSDAIYVGGGNTLKMMNLWKKFGVDGYLKQAHKKGVVLSGLSAGSICWFRAGVSDSRKYSNPNADLIKVSGLGLVDAVISPHFDSEKDRPAGVKKVMSKTKGVAIALEDCSAIEIVDEKYRIIRSNKTANAYRVYYKAGKHYKEKLALNTWSDVKSLLIK